MRNLGPIAVSAPNTSLTDATGKNLTLNTRSPFAKIDSTNNVSFQIIRLFFNTEPPNPPTPVTVPTTLKTLIYSYEHGYKYTPSSWFLVSLDNFSTAAGPEGTWILGNAAALSPSSAVLDIEVTKTHVNISIDKTWGIIAGVPQDPPNIIGYFVSIRSYIYVEGVSGGNVPQQA